MSNLIPFFVFFFFFQAEDGIRDYKVTGVQTCALPIFTGGIYALIATGFVIIYKATGVINFATGELMMLGAFFAYTAMEVARAPFLVALLVAAAGATALGALVERVVLRPLLGQMSEVAVSWRLRIGRAHRRAARCARAQPGSDPAAAGQGSCA